MMKKIFQHTLRLLLVVLIGTFMSPSFAWQMVDSHSEQADTSVVISDAGHHESHMHHHHDNDGDDDDAAHGQIGHLLSHLPVITHEAATTLLPATNPVAYPTHYTIAACVDAELPFKPPRSLPLI
ncbi:MAG: DUF2946 family protein [Nitrosomonadales bacterium]|nr:DUF2946 family protein [Nitrosomonadales bacterium]